MGRKKLYTEEEKKMKQREYCVNYMRHKYTTDASFREDQKESAKINYQKRKTKKLYEKYGTTDMDEIKIKIENEKKEALRKRLETLIIQTKTKLDTMNNEKINLEFD